MGGGGVTSALLVWAHAAGLERLPERSVMPPSRRLRALATHIVGGPPSGCIAGGSDREPLPKNTHGALEELFLEFRAAMFGERPTGREDLDAERDEDGRPTGGTVLAAPDFSEATMAAELAKVKGFQSQLAAFEPSAWPVEEQVDYHLVRAEMNGLEFQHRVLRPWALDPGHYNDVVGRLGVAEKKGQVELDHLPLSDEGVAEMAASLGLVRVVLEDGMRNLSADIAAVSADLGTLVRPPHPPHPSAAASAAGGWGLPPESLIDGGTG